MHFVCTDQQMLFWNNSSFKVISARLLSSESTVRHSDRWVYNAYTMTFFSEYVSFNLPESNMNDYKKILRALFEKIDFFNFWLKIVGCCKTDFE